MAAKMKYKNLGKTGLKVSELCLGAMTFGDSEKAAFGYGTAVKEDSFAMLDAFAAAGGNFIDTADAYGGGVSEEIVGEWLARHAREDFVIATKVFFPTGTGPNDKGLGRKHIRATVKQSLARLRTDYIDLYQIHNWDAETPLEETFAALHDLVKAGVVHYLGVSNFCGWQMMKALEVCRKLGLTEYVCVQPQYHMLCRQVEWDILAVCRAEGLACIPWSPLAGGWLSGRYRRGMEAPPADSRVAWNSAVGFKTAWDRLANEKTWGIVDALDAVAKEHGKTVAQVALRWVMQNDAITAPIVGAKTLAQLMDNLGATTFTLSAEQKARLDAASAIDAMYPWGGF
jgi:aryl-alcohol dehydrogenase-like predicted oxidoreductase